MDEAIDGWVQVLKGLGSIVRRGGASACILSGSRWTGNKDATNLS